MAMFAAIGTLFNHHQWFNTPNTSSIDQLYKDTPRFKELVSDVNNIQKYGNTIRLDYERIYANLSASHRKYSFGWNDKSRIVTQQELSSFLSRRV